jgi:hypothetical protein
MHRHSTGTQRLDRCEGDIMPFIETLPLDTATSQSIVDDLNHAYELLDAAMVHTLRTNAKMIETGRDIGLDPKSGQKLFTGLSACADAIMESRQNLITAHQQAHVIRMRSTAASEKMFGCPYPFGKAELEVAPRLQSVA